MPKDDSIVALEKNVIYDLFLVVTCLPLGFNGNANVVEVCISGKSVTKEEPKKGFDFIRGMSFPSQLVIYLDWDAISRVAQESIHNLSAKNNITG